MLIKRISLEIKVFVLLFVAVVIVIATGYLSYKSLSYIVSSVHNEVRPDLVLLAIKDVNYDLDKAENNIRLYDAGGKGDCFEKYNTVIESIYSKIGILYTLSDAKHIGKNDIDSVYSLIKERILIWDEMLKLSDEKRNNNVISLLSEKLAQPDTIIPPKRENFFQRIFKRNKAKVETDINVDKLRLEIANIEKREIIRAEKLSIKEQFLLNKNEDLSSKLNLYISNIEKKQNRYLARKVKEADYLASKTYGWLFLFCVSGVLLLIMVLFVIFNYVKNAKAYQKALIDAKIQAQELSKAKELFIANVSHELRSPMNAIVGMTEQLLKSEHDDPVKVQLTIVNKSANHLNGVVNDILDFSKMQAGKVLFERIQFNPRELFNEVFLQNKIIADKKNLSINLNIDKTVPDALIGDPLRLRQIVINLLDNALKFTSIGEVNINVYYVIQNQILKFSIEDTGLGIAEKELPFIFDEFTQAGLNISRDFGGTGLGLAIVNRLVALQAGEIEVESKLGQGTKFTVTIPLTVGKEIVVNGKQISYLTGPLQFENLSVLIVDDEEYNRTLLAVILAKYKISYKEVANGLEAVKEFSKNHYDIILMDIRMPIMDGIETSSKIFEVNQLRESNVNIIAISANSSDQEVGKCLSAGIKTVLIKPFKEEDLLKAICTTNCDEEHGFIEEQVKMDKENCLDLSELERMTNGDMDFMYSMLEMYIKTSLEGLTAMKEGIDCCEFEQIADAAHKIISPNRHLKAETIVLNLKRIEAEARKKNNMVGIIEIVNETELELNGIVDILKKEMESKFGKKVSV